MDVDPDILPLLGTLEEHLATVRTTLLPAFAALDEDRLLSHYPVEAQARLYLSAAFTLAMSLYALDRLQNRQAPPPKGTSHRQAPAAPGEVEPQLALKIERVVDYVRKLKAIVLENKPTASTASGSPPPGGRKRDRAAVEGDAASGATGTQPHAKVEEQTVGADRAAEATAEASPHGEATGADEFDDACMFSAVERAKGGATHTAVRRLLGQLTGLREGCISKARAAGDLTHLTCSLLFLLSFDL
ncbi:exosome-associated protein 3 [Strigomonas culicis]|uniref:Exosome-associated protein 3 n=1 Tax=Strigomonas culicis TaxID=28005 RepID=S9UC58_9TRYP|nr:exosome-associated protein 3 [Strigomonas culicis]|eukprot:EPY28392.1 exosome-associated protein 3 [Strigomonas culicis]